MSGPAPAALRARTAPPVDPARPWHADAPAPAIHLALAADGRYAMPLAVAISSAAAHCDRRRSLVVHVLHSAFGPALRRRVERSLDAAGHPDARIDWIAVDTARLAHLPVVHHYMSPLIYARLLLPALLPARLAKVLYLDADTLTSADLGALWDTDLAGRAVWAARDRIGHVGAPGGLARHAELGIAADAPYFNSGVLLMNLDWWRTNATAECVFAYLEAHRGSLRMGDQDGLNAVLHADWGELPFRWNWQIVPRMHRTGPMACWAPAEPERSLVHFTTSEKPWLPDCGLAERHAFFAALDRTDWAGWRVAAWREQWVRAKRRLRRWQRAWGPFRRNA